MGYAREDNRMQRINPESETVRTSISLEQDMVDDIEELVEWLNVTKSFFIRKALRAEIKRSLRELDRDGK